MLKAWIYFFGKQKTSDKTIDTACLKITSRCFQLISSFYNRLGSSQISHVKNSNMTINVDFDYILV